MKKLLEIIVLCSSFIMLTSCDYLVYKDCKKSMMKAGIHESEAAEKCRK
jgi:hypothetical protein